MRVVPLRWLPLLLAALPALASAQPAAGPDRVDPESALLFEARIGPTPIGDGVRAFDTGHGICLDLGDLVHTLDVAIAVAPDGRSASGWAFDEHHRIAIDRGADRAEFGSHVERLAPGTILESKSGWCVLAKPLGDWLGVRFEADMTNSVLHVASDAPLPVEAAAKRAIAARRLEDLAHERGAQAMLPHVALPYRPWRMPAIDLNLRVGMDRASGAAPLRTTSYELLAAGELAWFSSELRLASDERGTPASLRLKLYRDDPEAGLLGPLHATSLAFGDVDGLSSALVAQSVAGRGVALSNRPLALAATADRVDLVGTLPAGWEAELYRNGELLQTSRGESGRYAFRDVELLAGSNVIEVVRYGPQGQVRRERRLYNIAAQLPPRGGLWWSTDLVDGQHDLIDFRAASGVQRGWRYQASFDYGLGTGLSIGAGFHRMTFRQSTHDYVEANLRASLFGMLGEADVARDLSSGEALRLRLVGEALHTNVAVEGVLNQGLGSDRLDPNLRSSLRVSLDRPLHVGSAIVPLRFDLARVDSGGLLASSAALRASFASHGVSLSLSGGWEHDSVPGGLGSDRGTLNLLFNTRIGKVQLRGSADWQAEPTPRFTGAELTANTRIARRYDAQAMLGYSASDRALRYGLSFTHDFDRFALSANASGDTHGRLTLGINLLVNVGQDGNGRFGRLSSDSQAQGGSLLVRAFDDRNGDGVRQPGEPWVATPGLRVDGLPLRAGKRSDDATEIADLEAGVPVTLALDASTIADPFTLPSGPGVIAVPRAGVAAPIALGLVGTGTVEGVLSASRATAGGTRLELVGVDGSIAAQAYAEFDGSFSFEQLRYGRYVLRVQGAQAPLAKIAISADRAVQRLGRITVPN